MTGRVRIRPLRRAGDPSRPLRNAAKKVRISTGVHRFSTGGGILMEAHLAPLGHAPVARVRDRSR